MKCGKKQIKQNQNLLFEIIQEQFKQKENDLIKRNNNYHLEFLKKIKSNFEENQYQIQNGVKSKLNQSLILTNTSEIFVKKINSDLLKLKNFSFNQQHQLFKEYKSNQTFDNFQMKELFNFIKDKLCDYFNNINNQQLSIFQITLQLQFLKYPQNFNVNVNQIFPQNKCLLVAPIKSSLIATLNKIIIELLRFEMHFPDFIKQNKTEFLFQAVNQIQIQAINYMENFPEFFIHLKQFSAETNFWNSVLLRKIEKNILWFNKKSNQEKINFQNQIKDFLELITNDNIIYEQTKEMKNHFILLQQVAQPLLNRDLSKRICIYLRSYIGGIQYLIGPVAIVPSLKDQLNNVKFLAICFDHQIQNNFEGFKFQKVKTPLFCLLCKKTYNKVQIECHLEKCIKEHDEKYKLNDKQDCFKDIQIKNNFQYQLHNDQLDLKNDYRKLYDLFQFVNKNFQNIEIGSIFNYKATLQSNMITMKFNKSFDSIDIQLTQFKEIFAHNLANFIKEQKHNISFQYFDIRKDRFLCQNRLKQMFIDYSEQCKLKKFDFIKKTLNSFQNSQSINFNEILKQCNQLFSQNETIRNLKQIHKQLFQDIKFQFFNSIIICDLEFSKEQVDKLKQLGGILPSKWYFDIQTAFCNKATTKIVSKGIQDLNSYAIYSGLLFFLIENKLVELKRIEAFLLIDFDNFETDSCKIQNYSDIDEQLKILADQFIQNILASFKIIFTYGKIIEIQEDLQQELIYFDKNQAIFSNQNLNYITKVQIEKRYEVQIIEGPKYISIEIPQNIALDYGSENKIFKQLISDYQKQLQINNYYLSCSKIRFDSIIIASNEDKIKLLINFNKNNLILKKIKKNLKIRLKNKLNIMESEQKNQKNFLGCSNEEFKNYIFDNLQYKMNLDNYGKLWNIDHVLPLQLAGSSSTTNLISNDYLLNYTNLLPSFINENSCKGADIFPIYI